MNSNKPVNIPDRAFETHLHLIGATGTGKTTAIQTILRPLLRSTNPKCCLFLVDPMGNLSQDLLLWMADEQLCPQHVRDRLVYIEPARGDVVLPFNPLLHQSSDHLYYQVARAAEIVLRGWASQNIEEMPRLRNWVFASFFAAGRMGYPISACRYLLRPGSDEHSALLSQLPEELQNMWGEILRARGNEALRLLESTRNRLAPFFDSGILRRMFGSVQSRFDVERFIRERRIVILNVAGYGKLDSHISHTIGGLAVNEILQTAMNLSPSVVRPTFLLLDEFQHFVGNDLYEALPLVRQLGLRLILSHQSFSQLERGDIDLSTIIWQARSRIMFANDAIDADMIAEEIAKLSFDPYKLKEMLKVRRQRIVGHRREWLRSHSTTKTNSHATDRQEGTSWGKSAGESYPIGSYRPTINESDQSSRSSGRSLKDAFSSGESESSGETLVPIHEDFEEISSKTYFSFEEQQLRWAQEVRSLGTGQAFCKFKDDPELHRVLVNQPIVHNTARQREKREELIARNFASSFFVSKATVEEEEERLRQLILQGPVIEVPATISQAEPTPKLEAPPTTNEFHAASTNQVPAVESPSMDNPFM